MKLQKWMFAICPMNIRNFDLNLLLVFDALMDERNVTRAAERLHLSQPAVSAALNRLRDAFADPLFVRMQRGVLPTPRAIELAHAVKGALGQVENIIDVRRFDPAHSEAVFRIGANDYAQLAVVVPLIRRLAEVAPNIRLEIATLGPNLAEQLERQLIDFAITLFTEPPKGSHTAMLFRETYICAARKNHSGIGKTLSLDRFCNLPHIAVPSAGPRLADPVDEALAALGRKRRVMLKVPNFFILPRMLLDNDFIAVAPERLIQYFKSTLKALALPIEVPGFSMNLVWHERTHTGVAHAWMREQILSFQNQNALQPAKTAA
jgi:DNA-binding transcriptional LysR family regulator